MKRQALRSVSNTEDFQTAEETAETAVEKVTSAATTLAEDGKALADRTYAYVSRTVRENPTLAIAGVVAVGAVAALALMPRRTEPRSVARNMQRDLVKHTRDLRKIVRQELRDSGASAKFNDFSRALSSIDLKPYLQPLVDQAATAAQAASERLANRSK